MGEKDTFTTAVSYVKPGKAIIRGYDLVELIGRISFGDMVYLLFTGELPQKNEGKMIEAILVCTAEHGLNTPSTNAARSVASCGVPLQASVASGIIAIGDFHGGAIEKCAEMLRKVMPSALEKGYDEAALEIVSKYKETNKRMHGYGHGIHQPKDPRKIKLFELAEQYGIAGNYVKLADAIEVALKQVTQKSLPLNVDGAIAAIISDLGIDWRLGKAFFFIGRSAGLTAHVHEQIVKEKPMRRVYTWEDVNYIGHAERKL